VRPLPPDLLVEGHKITVAFRALVEVLDRTPAWSPALTAQAQAVTGAVERWLLERLRAGPPGVQKATADAATPAVVGIRESRSDFSASRASIAPPEGAGQEVAGRKDRRRVGP